MSSDKLSEAIEHYQRNLARGMRDGNNTKVMHCIFKLSNMPITTGHLEETGIGRTVNAMRKMDGEIGDAARTLVSKWKQMVSQNQDCDESTENTSTESTSKSHSSSHSRSDKAKNPEKRHSPRSEQETESESSSEETELHDNEGKSSASDNNSSGSEVEADDDDFRETSSKPKRSRHESPPPRRKNEEKKLSSKEKNGKHSRDKKDRAGDRREEDKRKRREDDDDKKHEKRRDKDAERNGKSKSSEKERKHARRDEERSSKQSSSSSSSKRKRDKSEERKTDVKHKDKDSSSKSSKHRSEDSKKSSTEKGKRDSSKENDGTKKKEQKNAEKRKTTDDKPAKTSTSKLEVIEQGISSECGTSFADALGMLEPSTSKNVKRPKPDKVSVLEKTPEKDRKPHRNEEREHRHDNDKKRSREAKEKPKEAERSPTKPRIPEIIIPPPPAAPLPKGDIDITSLLPTITPNYKPMPMFDFAQRAKVASDDYGALSLVMSQKNQRTKVYSGNKCGWGSVPSLFEMCIRILQDNIDALEYTGGVPYAILKPVLDKATPQQLYMMEHYNAYLMEDTDEIWKFHCQKEFKTKRREELESWRDMYMRCLDEREAKLKALTENIKQSQDKSTPVRQTKLAYMDSIVKPPRDIARKQAKNGVDSKRPLVTPQQRLNSIASGSSGAVSVPNPVRPISSGSSGIKPKKAPLMQKTLALLKGGRFRR